jgi:hypothetical protein
LDFNGGINGAALELLDGLFKAGEALGDGHNRARDCSERCCGQECPRSG